MEIMEHQKMLNLLNEANDSKFVIRKWNIANANSNANYYNDDYNDAYILVRGDITVTAVPETQATYKNYVPFTKCITKSDGTTIDDAENLDLVMSAYNLRESSSSYSETTGNLWFILKIKQLILMQILQTLIILILSSIRLKYRKYSCSACSKSC